MSLDRTNLLNLIRDELPRVLADHTALSDACEDVMQRCQAMALRSNARSSEVEQPNESQRPVPLEVVAAFLDGTLDRESSTAVCERAMWDAELVMELMLCVQSGDVSLPPLPISDELRQRLVGQVVETSGAHSASFVETPPATPPTRHRWLVPASIAATLVLAVGWYVAKRGGDANQPATPDMAVAPVPDPSTLPPISSEISKDADAVVVAPIPTAPDEAIATPNVIVEIPRQTVEMSEAVEREVEQPEMPQPSETNSIATIALSNQLNWSEINGVLVTSKEEGFDASSSRALLESGIDEEAVTQLASSQTLRTLPLSRAKATIASGGAIVLSSDSVVRFNDRGHVAVERGAIAMVGLPAGDVRTLTTKKGGAKITSVDRADWLLRRDGGGLWLDVLRGSVRYQDLVLANQSLRIEAAAAKRTDEDSVVNADVERPRWVDKTVDKISVPRTYLAQLRKSKDTASTLDRQLANMPRTSPQSTILTLLTWRVSLDERGLFELAGSPNALMRQAALMRMVALPPFDARHANVWRRVPSGMTSAVSKTLRDRFVGLWRSQFAGKPFRLTQSQANALVGVLQSNSVAGRATADFLLRRALNGGPKFDPTWTGTSQTRGVAGWRTFLQRAANR